MGIKSTLQLPKEHGSWGMFFIPLIIGFVVAREWNRDTTFFSVAATAGFLAREPFMAAWRSWRRKVESGRATRTTAAYVLIALGAGLPILPSYPWLAAVGGMGAALYVWHAEAAMRGEGRSAGVELLAIATSMLAAPAAYYVGTGRLNWTAALLWVLCFAYFASSVFYVKMRLAAGRVRDASVRAKSRRNCALYHAGLTAGIVALPVIVAAGYVPVIVRAFWYAIRPTSDLNLKQIGWIEVVCSLIFLVCVAVGLER